MTNGIVEAFSKSVRGLLAVGIVLPVVIAAVFGVAIPEWLQSLAVFVAGYYFASKGDEALIRAFKKVK